MKIISIERNGNGYKGLFTEDYRRYNRFNISPTKHQVIPLETSTAVSSYEEFIDIWKKCCKSIHFLNSPLEINELTLDALKEIEATSRN